MKKWLIIVALGLVVLTLHHCKDESPEPCKDAKEVSADFTINELVTSYSASWMRDTSFETDSVYSTSSVKFIPKQSNLEYYEWRIGTEIINEKNIIRREFPENKWITITLIVKSKPNTDCFPKDDGRDTVTKKFFSCGNIGLAPKWGYWFGIFDNDPRDTGTVELRWVDDKNDPKNISSGFIFNYPKGFFPIGKYHISVQGSTGSGGATCFLQSEFQTNNRFGKLLGYIDANRMLNVKFKETLLINGNVVYEYHTFKGQRIKK